MSAEPRVGVVVLLWRTASREQLLVGRGHSAASEEIHAFPGGHWERGETLAQAVRRELHEEAGTTCGPLRLVSVYDFFNEDKGRAYVSIGFDATWSGAEPVVMEPDKKAFWAWRTPSEALALRLFEPDSVLLRRSLSGVGFEE